MTSLGESLHRLRSEALALGVPTRRRDSELYQLLASCLEICETVERDGLHGELRSHIRTESSGGSGRGRRYVETKTSAAVLVCRYVLEGRDTRNSNYRYAEALRSAAEMQIRSGDLAEWLSKNGGVRGLMPDRQRSFSAREVEAAVLRALEAAASAGGAEAIRAIAADAGAVRGIAAGRSSALEGRSRPSEGVAGG